MCVFLCVGWGWGVNDEKGCWLGCTLQTTRAHHPAAAAQSWPTHHGLSRALHLQERGHLTSWMAFSSWGAGTSPAAAAAAAPLAGCVRAASVQSASAPSSEELLGWRKQAGGGKQGSDARGAALLVLRLEGPASPARARCRRPAMQAPGRARPWRQRRPQYRFPEPHKP